MKPSYRYKAELVRVIDGDTLDVIIDLGFGVTLREKLRLEGIDTYEIRGKETPKGLKAKAYVVRRLNENQNSMTLETFKKGKFGRWVATVFLADSPKTLNRELVNIKLAKVVHY